MTRLFRNRALLVATMLLVATTFAFANGQGEESDGAGITEPTTFRLAHVYNPGHVWDEGSKMAAEMVAEATDGLITIEVFPASQLGTEEQITEAVIFGSVDMSVAGAGQIGNLFKPIYVAEMPYTFEDLDHVMRFAESDIAQTMFDDLEEEFNIKIVGTSAFGIRHLVSVDQPVRSPDDLAGFKLRVPEQQVTVAYGRAMGADPTPIAYAEAYLALQQGVVDGLENPLSAIQSMKFYEVAQYINLTAHVTNLTFFLMNGDQWDMLSAEQKEIFSDAFGAASEYIVEQLKEDDQNLGSFFEEEGLEIIQPDVEAFRRKTATMPQEFSKWWIRYGQDLHQRIQEM